MHDSGLAVNLLWGYAERIPPLAAPWSFIQKTWDWTLLCLFKLIVVQGCGGNISEKGTSRDVGGAQSIDGPYHIVSDSDFHFC